MWDTAGQEKFKSLTRMYYQDAQAAILVYDITYQESFESVKKWIMELRENSNVPNCLIAIVGNKSDLYNESQVGIE
jgi:small GTP-binding protein